MPRIIDQTKPQIIYVTDATSGETSMDRRTLLLVPMIFRYQVWPSFFVGQIPEQIVDKKQRGPKEKIAYGSIEAACKYAWDFNSGLGTELVLASNEQAAVHVDAIIESMRERKGTDKLDDVWSHTVGPIAQAGMITNLFRGYELIKSIQQEMESRA